MPSIRGMILDVDGTLIDSNDAHAHAWVEALSEHGYHHPFDDAETSKPAPDIVQAALKRLGDAPDQTIMLGDTPYDIESAGKAGVSVIALRCGGWDDADLAGALAIYDDPADLLAHYDDSPLVHSASKAAH